MAVKGLFFNAIESGGVYDRVYNAEDFTGYLKQIVGNGVFPVPSTQLQVRAGSGMQIIVAAGEGWIDGHKLINTADLPLAVSAADTLLNRIDNVVFYCNYSNREMGIKVVAGTPATTPIAPALVRTSTEYQMCLARVSVSKQTSSITSSMITDTRASSNCGWVAGLIQQIDTSTLFQQWETAYSEFYASMQSWLQVQQNIYNSWFTALTDDLQVGAYVTSFDKFATVSVGQSGNISLDMTGYTYEPTDTIMVYINGLRAIPVNDYIINTSTTPVVVSINTSAVELATDVYIQVLKSYLGAPPANTRGAYTNATATTD